MLWQLAQERAEAGSRALAAVFNYARWIVGPAPRGTCPITIDGLRIKEL